MKDLLHKLDEPSLRQESLFAIQRFLIVLRGLRVRTLRISDGQGRCCFLGYNSMRLAVSFVRRQAANNSNADALKKATADCRAQVKNYAKYNETSWYGRRKMVKKCIKGMPWRKD
jgi:hypothetical protein